MDIIAGYKASKQNAALLKIFSEGFPEKQEVTRGLEDLVNKKQTTIQRFTNRWHGRKRPFHDVQSIYLLNAQETLERKRDEARMQAINFDLPIQKKKLF